MPSHKHKKSKKKHKHQTKHNSSFLHKILTGKEKNSNSDSDSSENEDKLTNLVSFGNMYCSFILHITSIIALYCFVAFIIILGWCEFYRF